MCPPPEPAPAPGFDDFVIVPGPRRGGLAAAAAAGALVALPGAATAAGGCSPYMGQVIFNEVRVGKSNSADPKNQIELLNVGGVAPAVWQTWSYQVWFKDGTKVPVRKGTYLFNAGHAANGSYIHGTTAKVWLQNRNNKLVSIAIFDAAGDVVAQFNIEGTALAAPACYGTVTSAQSSGSGDETGGIMRNETAGTWPASLTKTNGHSIGRSNSCSPGKDLVVSIVPNYSKPVAATTQVSYGVTVFNNSCTGISNTTGIEILLSNLGTTLFSGTASTPVKDVSIGTGSTLWKPADLAPGASASMEWRGTPKATGSLSATVAVQKPLAADLVSTGDDSDTATIVAYDKNYIGLALEQDAATEGTDSALTVSVIANVPVTANTTVSYSVGGTAGAGDSNLASGSVVIPSGSDQVDIEFTLTNDSVHEPTETIIVTLGSVTSADTKAAKGTAGTGDILVETITISDDDPLSVDHYELALPSAGVSCLAATATVTACADSSSPCTNPATSVNGQTATLAANNGSLGATTLTFNAGGTASTTFSWPAAANGATATITLSGESVAAPNPRRCCPDGSGCSAASSCGITLATAGLVIAATAGGAATTLPAQTAGTLSGGHVLRAVRTATGTQACEAALTGTRTVDWALECNDPGTCSSGSRMSLTGNASVAIAGNANGSSASRTGVGMTFDANGNAPFSFRYADVGQVTLHATVPAAGSLLTPLSGSSNAFVVRPAGFVLSALKCSSYVAGSCATTAIASPGNNPGAADAAGSAFLPAGAAFSATVTAVDASGNAVPNYGRETVPEGVKLVPALVQPVGGTLGSIANDSAFGSFSAGAATGTGFSYSEVGIVTLTPAVADGNYLGAGNVTGTTSGNVGRFIPARFALGGGSVSHRAGLACSPASTFSHLGENFRLAATLTAQNASGATTTNYRGAFAKFDPASPGAWQLAGVAAGTVFSTGNGRLSLGSASGSWVDGVLASATLTAQATRAASPEGPFAASFGVAPVDSDGVTVTALNLAVTAPFSSFDRATVASVPLRYGRLRLASAMGPADRPLALPVTAQHWDGSAWATNTLDSCSTVPAAAVNFGHLRGTLGTADTAASAAVTVTGGRGSLRLAAPGGGRSGALSVALSLGSAAADASCLQPWTPGTGDAATAGANLGYLRGAWCGGAHDKDPAARAAFGRASGNEHLVFRRENY